MNSWNDLCAGMDMQSGSASWKQQRPFMRCIKGLCEWEKSERKPENPLSDRSCLPLLTFDHINRFFEADKIVGHISHLLFSFGNLLLFNIVEKTL